MIRSVVYCLVCVMHMCDHYGSGFFKHFKKHLRSQRNNPSETDRECVFLQINFRFTRWPCCPRKTIMETADVNQQKRQQKHCAFRRMKIVPLPTEHDQQANKNINPLLFSNPHCRHPLPSHSLSLFSHITGSYSVVIIALQYMSKSGLPGP